MHQEYIEETSSDGGRDDYGGNGKGIPGLQKVVRIDKTLQVTGEDHEGIG